MDKAIFQTAMGPEASFDLGLVDGRLAITLSYQGEQAGAKFIGNVSAVAFLEKLKAAIPGSIDDIAIDLLVKSLELK